MSQSVIEGKQSTRIRTEIFKEHARKVFDRYGVKEANVRAWFKSNRGTNDIIYCAEHINEYIDRLNEIEQRKKIDDRCKEEGVTFKRVKYHMDKDGISFEEALTKLNNSTECYAKHRDLIETCKRHGVKWKNVRRYAESHNVTLKEAVDWALNKESNKSCYIANGVKYDTVVDVAKALNLGRGAVKGIIKRHGQNCDIAEYVDEIQEKVRLAEEERVIYNNAIEYLRSRGVVYHTLKEWLKRHNYKAETPQDVLDGLEVYLKSKNGKGIRKVWKAFGKEYKGFIPMCKSFGINSCTVKVRMANGMTLEEALTADVRQRGATVFGVEYKYRCELRNDFRCNGRIISGSDKQVEDNIKKVLRHRGIIQSECNGLYICKCPKCNRSVYVTENKMVEFIRHIDDNMCKQHELQEA